jgi:hypothetical protein
MKDTVVGLIMFAIAIFMVATFPRHTTPVHSVQTPTEIEQVKAELEATKAQLTAAQAEIKRLQEQEPPLYAERDEPGDGNILTAVLDAFSGQLCWIYKDSKPCDCEALRHYVYMRDGVHKEGAKW